MALKRHASNRAYRMLEEGCAVSKHDVIRRASGDSERRLATVECGERRAEISIVGPGCLEAVFYQGVSQVGKVRFPVSGESFENGMDRVWEHFADR